MARAKGSVAATGTPISDATPAKSSQPQSVVSAGTVSGDEFDAAVSGAAVKTTAAKKGTEEIDLTPEANAAQAKFVMAAAVHKSATGRLEQAKSAAGKLLYPLFIQFCQGRKVFVKTVRAGGVNYTAPKFAMEKADAEKGRTQGVIEGELKAAFGQEKFGRYFGPVAKLTINERPVGEMLLVVNELKAKLGDDRFKELFVVERGTDLLTVGKDEQALARDVATDPTTAAQVKDLVEKGLLRTVWEVLKALDAPLAEASKKLAEDEVARQQALQKLAMADAAATGKAAQ
jgi:hypothetical protein